MENTGLNRFLCYRTYQSLKTLVCILGGMIKHTDCPRLFFHEHFVFRGLTCWSTRARDLGNATLNHESPCGHPIIRYFPYHKKTVFNPIQRPHSSSYADSETGASLKTLLFPVGSEEPGCEDIHGKSLYVWSLVEVGR